LEDGKADKFNPAIIGNPTLLNISKGDQPSPVTTEQANSNKQSLSSNSLLAKGGIQSTVNPLAGIDLQSRITPLA
jgi:hypothetical protein